MFEYLSHLFHRNHYWSRASLSELGELYSAFTLRALSVGLVGIFVPIFLYREGYNIAEISQLYLVSYALRFIADPLIAKLSIRIGLHHMIGISYVFLIAFLILLQLLPFSIASLYLLGLIKGMNMTTFHVPFYVDLAAYSHKNKAGRELSRLSILQKFAGVLGPLLGGLVATYFGINHTMILAIFVLMIATIIILSKSTTPKRHFSYNFKFSDYWEYRRYFPAGAAWASIDFGATIVWPLFIAITVLSQDDVYAELGVVTTISVSISVISAYLFGKLIDKHEIKLLKSVSSFLMAIGNTLRVFVSTILGILSLNMVTEPSTTAMLILYDKGLLSSAEDSRKQRFNVIIAVFSYVNLMRVLIWIVVYLVAINASDVTALKSGLILAGLGSLAFVTRHFEALNE